jgi:hypothetical protein
MNYLKWNDVLTTEGVNNLYPMHYRPNKENTYSVFLITDSSRYVENNKEIEHKGTGVIRWINDNFHSLANSKISSETVKVYYQLSPDRWESKGFYRLAGGSVKGDDYRFRLVPLDGALPNKGIR